MTYGDGTWWIDDLVDAIAPLNVDYLQSESSNWHGLSGSLTLVATAYQQTADAMPAHWQGEAGAALSESMGYASQLDAYNSSICKTNAQALDELIAKTLHAISYTHYCFDKACEEYLAAIGEHRQTFIDGVRNSGKDSIPDLAAVPGPPADLTTNDLWEIPYDVIAGHDPMLVSYHFIANDEIAADRESIALKWGLEAGTTLDELGNSILSTDLQPLDSDALKAGV